MTRLKLPPYGRALLERRRGGDHPLEVALIYGHDWRADVGGVPRIALNPEDYEPGGFDWHLFAGIKVVIHDQEVTGAEFDENLRPPTFGKFYDLITEVAVFAAFIEIAWPARCGLSLREATELARSCRWFDRETKKVQWPRWWSDDIEAQYARRMSGWLMDCGVRVGVIERKCVKAA